MHARGGLQTEYLSQEWFDVTRSCIHEAKRLGMCAWAYDENGWPSGFGAGAVCGKGVEYQQKYLRFRGAADVPADAAIIAVYDAAFKLQSAGSPCPPDGYAAFYEINPYYVDTLDGKVIAEFIHSTYQCYYDNLNEVERAVMLGFFTDEPQISRNGTPWSFILEAEYLRDWQEELLPLLPGLFKDNAPEARRTRVRFWRTVTHLFSDNFYRQIYEWCHAHGWQLTGHLVCEEWLVSQLASNGACMPHYEYLDIPGFDLLGRQLGYVTGPLQLCSAAAQTGHRQILTETFALCGWAVDFTDLRWLLQWQMVHGVNLLCQHLQGYSLRGIRKRDYPASHFRHQPWWQHDHLFVDYVSRIGTLLEAGEINYDVLLLHPQSSAHVHFNDADNGKLEEYNSSFLNCTNSLESAQINHHYGDETLMARHGSVQNGKLVIGEQAYSVVIVPELCNLSDCQVKMLMKFAEQGGIILGVENSIDPDYFAVDGVETTEHPLLKQVRWYKSIDALIQDNPNLKLLDIKTEEAEAVREINVSRRTFADFDGKPARLYYLVNNNRKAGCIATIEIPGKGVEKYDPATGDVTAVEYTVEDGICRVRHEFTQAGDLLLLSRDYPVPSAPPALPPAQALKLGTQWRMVKHTGNLLTLDYCRCFADGRKVFDREYVLSVHDWLLTLERDVPVVLEYEFDIDAAAANIPMEILVERPERYAISVNGKAVDNTSSGYFADPAFQRISIAGVTVPGRNVVRMETVFKQSPEIYANIRAAKVFESELNKLCYDSEIEAIYVIGDFGVKASDQGEILADGCLRHYGEYTITSRPEIVDGSNVCLTGLPFFSGTLTLEQKVTLSATEAAERSCVRFSEVWSNVLQVKVNGTACGTCIYPPFECVIPQGVLKSGENLVEITLSTSLRNMLGPHHLEEGECLGVGPVCFYEKDGGPFRKCCPYIHWNKGYSFLPVGVRN
jgi:hypothetical protein